MSQKGTRKSQTAAAHEDKDKVTDSPVKDMKKKMAANAEKEKQDKHDKNAEKSDNVTDKTQADKDKSAQKNVESKNVSTPDKTKPDKNAQKTDRSAEKMDRSAEKVDKSAEKTDKSAEKADKVEKKTEKPTEKKTEKPTEKKTEKPAEKKTEKPTEKKTDKSTENKNEQADKKEEAKGDASGKDKQSDRPQQNGKPNGAAHGTDTVSEDSDDDLALAVDDQDELFPELAYDDTSDPDYESEAPSRSLTRRSQVKVTKTPETPRPLSVKEDDPKDGKVLKMNDSLATDRKLRSADSPKPETKRESQKKDTPKVDPKEDDKTVDLTEDDTKGEANGDAEEKGKKLEMDVVVEIECMEGEPRTGMKTRARVSPYTRAAKHDARTHDQTTSSLTANYTGNNTTMEMDISESSLDEAAGDSPYLRGLRAIRGRSSYKPLKELSFKHTLDRSARAAVNTSLSELSRPTGTVVGRKRKPDADESIEVALDAAGVEPATLDSPAPLAPLPHSHTKRMRLFDRFPAPFRGFTTTGAAEIVGINTDLPLTAPVASTSTFDPESLKSEPIAVPLAPAHQPTHDRDGKRCAIM